MAERGRRGRLTWADAQLVVSTIHNVTKPVAAWSDGHLAVLLGDEADERLTADLQRLKTTFGDRCYMALIRRFAPDEYPRLWAVEQAAPEHFLPLALPCEISHGICCCF
jgi:hypothetical protein